MAAPSPKRAVREERRKCAVISFIWCRQLNHGRDHVLSRSNKQIDCYLSMAEKKKTKKQTDRPADDFQQVKEIIAN